MVAVKPVRLYKLSYGIESKKINNIKGLYKQIESVLLIKTKPLELRSQMMNENDIKINNEKYFYFGGAVPAGLPLQFLYIGTPYPSIITACHCTIILQFETCYTHSNPLRPERSGYQMDIILNLKPYPPNNEKPVEKTLQV
ncbi:hypothetical protein H8356DRAFT_1351904 [Neocallimastix lanati (nom. inval.)]|nr:hypothetical protein H8356DRAFT_1351904 [Neocallimastix sp. JGI-2020a]